jgi:hypothetical protein
MSKKDALIVWAIVVACFGVFSYLNLWLWVLFIRWCYDTTWF